MNKLPKKIIGKINTPGGKFNKIMELDRLTQRYIYKDRFGGMHISLRLYLKCKDFFEIIEL